MKESKVSEHGSKDVGSFIGPGWCRTSTRDNLHVDRCGHTKRTCGPQVPRGAADCVCCIHHRTKAICYAGSQIVAVTGRELSTPLPPFFFFYKTGVTFFATFGTHTIFPTPYFHVSFCIGFCLVLLTAEVRSGFCR